MLQDQVPTQKSSPFDHWLAVLDAHGVQFLILDRQRDGQLLHLVQSDPRWIADSSDGDSMLFARVQILESTQATTW